MRKHVFPNRACVIRFHSSKHMGNTAKVPATTALKDCPGHKLQREIAPRFLSGLMALST